MYNEDDLKELQHGKKIYSEATSKKCIVCHDYIFGPMAVTHICSSCCGKFSIETHTPRPELTALLSRKFVS